MSEVRDVLREVRLTIGSEGDSGEHERQQARVKRMLTAMGVADEELDNELRDHRQQQEAAAAEAEEVQLNGVDTLIGVAGGVPTEEGVGQDGQRDDVDMEVEGAADARDDKDVPCRFKPPIAWSVIQSSHDMRGVVVSTYSVNSVPSNQHAPKSVAFHVASHRCA